MNIYRCFRKHLEREKKRKLTDTKKKTNRIMNVISNLVVIYSIFAANLKICLYLHLTRFIIDSHVRRSTTPIAITHSHIAIVRILSFSFHFFPSTLFVCVNKNKMHNYSLNHRSEQRRQKAVKLPYKQTLSLILIAIHTQRSIILYRGASQERQS